MAAAAPELDAYLGVADLQQKFEDRARGNGWSMALMEMLVDPMLSEWVPEWVVEQYERANPYFRTVLNRLKRMEARELNSNRVVLARTRREMVRRHQMHKRRKQAVANSKRAGGTSSEDDDSSADAGSDDTDVDAEANALADAMGGEDRRDEEDGVQDVGVFREPRPEAGVDGVGWRCP